MKTRSASELAPVYDAVVVGSGYGGGVAASRLSRMGFKVAVLEQGRNWQPGDFPNTIKARLKATRISGRFLNLGDPTGLYRLSVGRGLTVLSANGLGGGSLINAGAACRPDLAGLRSAGWPGNVVNDGLMLEGFARAEAMFGVEPVPEAERFAKYAGMRKAARAADRSVQLPPVTIMHRSGKNPAGLFQNACEYCGDCYSGCNAGAKITVGQTYIADAAHHGAEVFSGSRAESISQADRGWQILVKDQTGAGGSRQVEADILVLAAGTMGTTELLLRAKKRGLALSEMLGEKFSANGDDMVLAAELDEPVNAVATGYPTLAPPETPKVGTHSMAMIDLGDEDGHMCLYDGTMINMMAAMAPLNAIMEFRLRRAVKLLKDGIYGDALSRTQLYYIVGQDDASGRLRLQGDSIFVDWPDYNTSTARVAAEEKVKTLIEQMGGVFKKNPFESRAFGGNRVIAHPLGGCAMAETVDDGVVAPDGRVFDLSNGPNGVHEGLYVCDGAFIPSSLGVSPLLTISALAERTMMLAAERLGRNLDVSSPPRRAQRNATM